jgi:hypothetical protein
MHSGPPPLNEGPFARPSSLGKGCLPSSPEDGGSPVHPVGWRRRMSLFRDRQDEGRAHSRPHIPILTLPSMLQNGLSPRHEGGRRLHIPLVSLDSVRNLLRERFASPDNENDQVPSNLEKEIQLPGPASSGADANPVAHLWISDMKKTLGGLSTRVRSAMPQSSMSRFGTTPTSQQQGTLVQTCESESRPGGSDPAFFPLEDGKEETTTHTCESTIVFSESRIAENTRLFGTGAEDTAVLDTVADPSNLENAEIHCIPSESTLSELFEIGCIDIEQEESDGSDLVTAPGQHLISCFDHTKECSPNDGPFSRKTFQRELPHAALVKSNHSLSSSLRSMRDSRHPSNSSLRSGTSDEEFSYAEETVDDSEPQSHQIASSALPSSAPPSNILCREEAEELLHSDDVLRDEIVAFLERTQPVENGFLTIEQVDGLLDLPREEMFEVLHHFRLSEHSRAEFRWDLVEPLICVFVEEVVEDDSDEDECSGSSLDSSCFGSSKTGGKSEAASLGSGYSLEAKHAECDSSISYSDYENFEDFELTGSTEGNGSVAMI